MNKNPCQELTDLLKGEPLGTFDVREYVLAQVKEALRHDICIYDSCDGCSKFLIKTAIGKKWAGKIGYDYDASYFANLIYKAAFFPSGSITPFDSSKYEYYIRVHGRCFRGDTMNSWKTTLIEYFRLFGNQHLKYLTENKAGRNKGKWRVPDVCPEKLAKDFGANWSYVGWEDFLSIPKVYDADHPIPPYISEFMKVAYTIGNFIPVPSGFQRRGTGHSKDYWDLALMCIYNDYAEKKEWPVKWPGYTLTWLLSGNAEALRLCRKWLDSYESWDAFVEGNFLQDFVDEKTKNGYGMPKPLWTGHFDGNIMPRKDEDADDRAWQFREYFTNAAAWITARGTRIAAALAKSLGSAKEPESDAGEGSI